MHHKMIVMLAVAFLCVAAWAVPNVSIQPPVTVSVDGEASGPTRNARVPGDIPAGCRPRPAPEPTPGEPPQLVEVAGGADGGAPAEPKPLWGPDVTVFDGHLKYITPYTSERMIAYDQTESGVLFAAFTVANGDTAKIYRSTDGGNTWAYWNAIRHTSQVLTSLELVVAEGDSDFVFFFVKSSAGNGDIYVGRWNLASTTADLFSVKVDSDTIANLSACRDLENHYSLYVAYERRAADYGMYQLRSTDYGKTWGEMNGTEEIVDTRTPPRPDICCGSDGRIYTIIRDLRQSSTDSASFRLKYSPSRGDTWYASTQIGTPTVTIAEPVVGAKHDTDVVWLVHARNLGGERGWDLYSYARSDTGETWNLDAISNTNDDEQMPSIATTTGSGAATLCYQISPGESIMFTWASNASTWIPPLRVSDHQATGFFAPQAGWMDGVNCVLYAGYTAVGLYFDGYYLADIEEGRPVVEKPAALAARPSPAIDRTVISYSLPSTGRTRVSILDVAGRQVAVLEDATLAVGAHSAVWNCEKAPAGVYLVRVDTGTGSQSGRLVVSH